MDTGNELVKTFRLGLVDWYDFRPDSSVLYIGKEREAIPGSLARRNVSVICATVEESMREDWQSEHGNAFAYLICVADLEGCQNPEEVLTGWHRLLSENGVLLLGMNNRLGIRYFCGDCDPYTQRVFDGVDNYRYAPSTAKDFHGRMYSRAEMEQLLHGAGFSHVKSYAVLPDLDHPFLLYADGCFPNENLATRVQPVYHSPKTVFLEEESLYQPLAGNGLFHAMANSYLWECSLDGTFSDVQHVTCSVERGRENALFTVIRSNRAVEKRAIFPQGEKRLHELAENMQELSERGVAVVLGKLEGSRYVMPHVAADTGQVYLKRLLLKDREKAIEVFDRFRDEILRSSDIVAEDKGDGRGITLAKGYYDFIPLNSFYMDGKFVFFDQEFSYENFPANAILYRMVASFYAGNAELEQILPRGELFARYGLEECHDVWQRMDREFISGLRNHAALSAHRSEVLRDAPTMLANRHRMNYSAMDYQRHIVNPLKRADTRKLFLFGAGKFAKNFLDTYGNDYDVCAILDNQESKWGTTVKGIAVYAPEFLDRFSHGEYWVLICVKEFAPIAKQLENMGVSEYGVFTPSRIYPKPRRPHAADEKKGGIPAAQKKYHVGYVAGVFDLFHIGHLNILRRAKEQCDYLIVGVVSDRQVREGKNVEPFVPFEERIDMVRSCRYVDEAHEIPFEHPDTNMAWKLYRFDVQFSGSDYEDDPAWLAKKKWLEARGATMVFFPYTESTSSTKLKKLIEKKLL